MNLPEEQLRSWRPRRPSARLKRRIFRAAGFQIDLVWTVRWLAPAAACLLLAAATFGYRDHLSNAYSDGSFSATGSLEHAISQLANSDYRSSRNNLSPITFEWTNRSGFTSSNSSFLPGKTN